MNLINIKIFTLVIYLDLNFDFSRNRPKSTKISFFTLIVRRIVRSIFIWKLNRSNEKMVLFI